MEKNGEIAERKRGICLRCERKREPAVNALVKIHAAPVSEFRKK